jgi:hypothetical protein
MGAEEQRHWTREIEALTLDQVLQVVGLAWRRRRRGRRGRSHWMLIANNANLVRHELGMADSADEAWLRRQLEGLGQGKRNGA